MIQKQLPTDASHYGDDWVTVSNGMEFFRIPMADFADAQADGFYRPADRGLTIVDDGEHLFEIPIADLEAARSNGCRDLLAAEHSADTQPSAKPTHQAQPLPLTGRSASADSTSNSDVDSVKLFAGLTQAEQEAEAQRLEQENALAELTGWRWYALWLQFWFQSHRTNLMRRISENGISILVHVALLLLLASLVLATEEPKDILITASSTTEDVVEEIVIEPTPLEITEPTEEMDSEAPAEEEEVAVETVVAAPDFLAGVKGDAVKPPAKPAAEKGNEGMDKPSKKPTIFGSKFSAINYVFVIDNSNSMTKGRFETAITELMMTVNQLTPKQRFYVIFYSDTAYPMMHPRPVTQLVAATTRNKQLLYQWLQTVELCLRTNGRQAIQAAFDLQPDVIYILGDGAFTDGAGKYFAARPHKRIIVHTRGMEVKEQDAEAFRRLAESNRGTYLDVGVSQQGALMARQNPRPRNRYRGPVWGVALPVEKQ